MHTHRIAIGINPITFNYVPSIRIQRFFTITRSSTLTMTNNGAASSFASYAIPDIIFFVYFFSAAVDVNNLSCESCSGNERNPTKIKFMNVRVRITSVANMKNMAEITLNNCRRRFQFSRFHRHPHVLIGSKCRLCARYDVPINYACDSLNGQLNQRSIYFQFQAQRGTNAIGRWKNENENKKKCGKRT